jgi:hypothetical protein
MTYKMDYVESLPVVATFKKLPNVTRRDDIAPFYDCFVMEAGSVNISYGIDLSIGVRQIGRLPDDDNRSRRC